MRDHLRVLESRFGIPAEVFEQFATRAEQETVFIGTREALQFDEVRPLRRGIRLLRIFPRSIKPTTWAMQLFGRYARRNLIDVTAEQAAELINGSQIRIDADVEDGFVLIRWQRYVVGVGLYHRPVLKSHIPRNRPVD
ncbi:MAG: hypothetical protein ABIK44_05110 [candidate division WOR-3 bacterium]